MAALKIRCESLPARCEICHQFDRFDAEANYCSRCVDVVSESLPQDCGDLGQSIDNRALWDGLAVGAVTVLLLVCFWAAIVYNNNYMLMAILLLLILQLCRQ